MYRRLILAFLSWSLVGSVFGDSADDRTIELPKLSDDRLTIELFACEPDIVTPFGITVDRRGRVLVVESHTHMRPDDYDGPRRDRLRLLVDTDFDGRADTASTFYEGDQWLMNVAAHPNGWIYAITRNELFRIRDSDDDGVSDDRESLAKMQTAGKYPHNGFLSLTFDFDGNVYLGMGQNHGAAYVFTGVDGRQIISQLGDGGVFRCTADGKDLTRLANGFWNPCGLGFDVFGRLFTVDNDPGNRPPCRFIEVVTGGDFGYRRHALEPFISWNGELPGTLPMITSTAEAPTAVVAYESDQLPDEYQGDLLVSSWSEYRIDRFRLRPNGASFQATTRPLAVGNDEFRPTGIAVAPDGSLLVSDWVDRSYSVHGRGRVWRIRRAGAPLALHRSQQDPSVALLSPDRTAREDAVRRLVRSGQPGIRTLKLALQKSHGARIRSAIAAGLFQSGEMDRKLATSLLSDASREIREQAVRSLPIKLFDALPVLDDEPDLRIRATLLRRVSGSQFRPAIIAAIKNEDRFLSQAASFAFGNAHSLTELRALFTQPDVDLRQAAILAIRTKYPDQVSELLDLALDDKSEDIRFSAIEWIAQAEMSSYRQPLIDSLGARSMSARVFEATLAAVAQIDGVMRDWRPGRNGDWWKPRSATYDIASRILASPKTTSTMKQRAIEFLPHDHNSLTLDRLLVLIADPDCDVDLQLAVVRVLWGNSQASKQLQQIASNTNRPIDVRAEAILGVDPTEPSQRTLLMRLATGAQGSVQHEALRSLRGAELTSTETAELKKVAAQSDDLSQLVALALGASPAFSRPPVTDTAAWLKLVDRGGDPHAGARVFFHPRGPGCAKCHRIDGRGQQVGPSFTRARGIAGFTRRKLVESILQPSKEIALGYVPMQIVTTDGRVYVGVPQEESEKGEYQLVDATGRQFSIQRSDIELFAPHSQSIMPDGLIATLTDREFRDLVAFLMQPEPLPRP